jgi:hypothetical protein
MVVQMDAARLIPAAIERSDFYITAQARVRHLPSQINDSDAGRLALLLLRPGMSRDRTLRHGGIVPSRYNTATRSDSGSRSPGVPNVETGFHPLRAASVGRFRRREAERVAGRDHHHGEPQFVGG